MRVKVGPARRLGDTKTIYDDQLSLAEVNAEKDGAIELSFDALGIRCDKSRYRYKLKLSREDISKIIDAAKCAGMVSGAGLLQVVQQLLSNAPLTA